MIFVTVHIGPDIKPVCVSFFVVSIRFSVVTEV